MDWLNKITITCFAASYAVVLVLEISRVFFHANFRRLIRLGFMAAGMFAHAVYLVLQSRLEFGQSGIWMGSWFGWCMAAAWLLAAAYLWIAFRQSESALGLFLLPVLLALIVVGYQFDNEARFSTGQAKTVWNMVHGSSLLLGTAAVALGFVFGLVYLIQARRVKTKVMPSRLFKLPSLEWLQRCCERSLIISTVLLGVGLVSGIAINLINRPGGTGSTIAWSNPVVWSSLILFGWMLFSTLVNFVYQPSRQGRKVAYVVVVCAAFLLLELGIVWWSGHATDTKTAKWDRLPACHATLTGRVRLRPSWAEEHALSWDQLGRSLALPSNQIVLKSIRRNDRLEAYPTVGGRA